MKSHIAVLRVLYPDTNQHAAERLGRQYILVLHHDPALPDVYQIITYRGGAKQAATAAVEYVEDFDSMLKNARVKMRDRFNHGYILTWYTSEFPLMGWVEKGGYEVEFMDGYLPPGVQLHLPFVEPSP